MSIDKNEIEHRTFKMWGGSGLGYYGVKDIFTLVRREGIRLIRYPFGKDKILGFATEVEGKAVIVSNSSVILSREIFTIAHELGHVIYDFNENRQILKVDGHDAEDSDDPSEQRAFYFAACLLMPKTGIENYIRHELEKDPEDLGALDIVRMQLEFRVGYAAMLKRLEQINLIVPKHRRSLFDARDQETMRFLFRTVGADESLLEPADIIQVPPEFLEYAVSNFDKGYIPFESLQKAFRLIGADIKAFKKHKPSEKN